MIAYFTCTGKAQNIPPPRYGIWEEILCSGCPSYNLVTKPGIQTVNKLKKKKTMPKAIKTCAVSTTILTNVVNC